MTRQDCFLALDPRSLWFLMLEGVLTDPGITQRIVQHGFLSLGTVYSCKITTPKGARWQGENYKLAEVLF